MGQGAAGTGPSDRVRARDDPHFLLQEAKFDLLDLTTGRSNDIQTKAKTHWWIALELITTGRYDAKGEIAKIVKKKVAPAYQRFWAARGVLAADGAYDKIEVRESTSLLPNPPPSLTSRIRSLQVELTKVRSREKVVINRLKSYQVSSIADDAPVAAATKEAFDDVEAFHQYIDTEFPGYDGERFVDKLDSYKKGDTQNKSNRRAEDEFWFGADISKGFTKAISAAANKKDAKSIREDLINKYNRVKATYTLREHQLAVAELDGKKEEKLRILKDTYEVRRMDTANLFSAANSNVINTPSSQLFSLVAASETHRRSPDDGWPH